jgi:hypothetical protein
MHCSVSIVSNYGVSRCIILLHYVVERRRVLGIERTIKLALRPGKD